MVMIYDHFIWVNYNNSLTWIKAILGWFALLTMIPVRSQWGRYNLPRFHMSWSVSPEKNPYGFLFDQIQENWVWVWATRPWEMPKIQLTQNLGMHNTNRPRIGSSFIFFTGQSHNTPLFNQPGFLSLKFEPRIRNYWVMSLLDDTNWGDENSPFHTGIMRIYSNVNKPLLFAVNHNENIQNFFPVNSHGR